MALEATHIRFALDLKEKYKIKDIEKYVVGAIYPDSRYVSGIDRTLTHNSEILKPEFAKDDFHKGWQAHQLTDVIQTEILKECFVYLFPTFVEKNEFANGEWEIFSTLKIIQDIDDMQKFNLASYLKYLKNYAFNPNGEKLVDIEKYNQIIVDLYKNKKKTTVEDNYEMWLALGINREAGERIKKQTEKLLKNKQVMKKVKGVYGEMLKRCL